MKRTPLQCKIPEATRHQLEQDIFMQRCVIGGNCEGQIQWHHNLIYGGKRKNEWWSILPVCEKHHKEESKYKKELNIAMCKRAPIDELIKYSKVINYAQIKTQASLAE